MSGIFFSVQDIIFPIYILASFFPSKSVWRVFFSEISNGRPLKSTNLCSVDRFSFVNKAFWNNMGQNSLGERGGIRLYLPLYI